jgi:geranylgeranyl diphosphate synthase type I
LLQVLLCQTVSGTIEQNRSEIEQESGRMGNQSANQEMTAIDTNQIIALLELEMRETLRALDGPIALLPGMVNYHLGFVDTAFRDADLPPSARGKRFRPAIAMLACAAVGGDPERASPLAAAIELLHNFTLIHDDIQDQSPVRRHRTTVWTEWGIAQAINAGDAAFAAAQLALLRLREHGVEADLILRLADAFNQMTIQIVQGQALDLDFEGRATVRPSDYLTMIELKTAVIVRFAAWAGALIGGADDERADRFAEFGRSLGVGFQVRDDLLGIWGATATTGKAAADDIRRRKQSLPILMLRDRVDAAGKAQLNRLYDAPEIDDSGIAEMLALLERYKVRTDVEARIAELHEEAGGCLVSAAAEGANPARDALAALVSMLADREH